VSVYLASQHKSNKSDQAFFEPYNIKLLKKERKANFNGVLPPLPERKLPKQIRL
jgi:hypothetical protein